MTEPGPTEPGPTDAGTAPAALPVGAVARLLRMATPTLRTWDRRYGLGPTGHTGGSHRRYTTTDVARLTLMRRLMARGTPAAEAAGIVAGTPDGDLPPVRFGETDATGASDLDTIGPGGRVTRGPVGAEPLAPDDPLEAAVDRLAAALATAAFDGLPLTFVRGRGSGGRAVLDALGGRVPARARRIARAVLLLDSSELTGLLMDSMSRQGVVATWESLVAPVLRAVGREWELSGSGMEAEHLFSETVLTVLRHRTVSLGGDPGNASPALLACGPEEQHSLPLYAVAAALAERWVEARVLGPRVPTAVLADAVRRSRPGVVFVWSQLPGTAVLDRTALAAAHPGTRVVVGGPGWDPAALESSVLRVEDLGRAVEVVRALAG